MNQSPRSLRLAALIVTSLAGSLVGPRYSSGQETDRLSQIIAGDAFNRLGDHGQSVALYLAATQARTWDDARPFLERIWGDHPDSTAVDVAYAFAGRHYRDVGETEQAVRYFQKALQAAQERDRPWIDILLQELRRLQPRYAQAPPAPGPQAPVTPRTIEVRPDSEIGRWKTVTDPQSTMTTRPDGVLEIRAEVVTLDYFVALFHVAQDLTVTSVSLRLKIDPAVDYRIQFRDQDDTLVVVTSDQFEPDADGWRQIDADFATLRNTGRGNFVMGKLAVIGLSVISHLESGTKIQALIDDMTFQIGDPVRTADAPPGQAALQPRRPVAGKSEATWRPSGVTVTPDEKTTDDGRPSVRLSANITEFGGKGSGGHVNFSPPADAHWLGDRLVFWCFPRDVAFLFIIIHDKDGVMLSSRLETDDLVVGQWNRVEVLFAEANRFDTSERDAFGEVARVFFVPHTDWDRERKYFKQPGEYVWYIADMHVEGDGPAPLPARVAQLPPAGTTDENGASWYARKAVSLVADAETVHDGRTSMRLSAVIEGFAGEGSGGHATLIPPRDAPWLGERLVFWCFPRDVAFLPVIINSKDHVQLSTVLGPDDLVVGEWNRVEIPFEEAHQTATTLAEEFGEIGLVFFVPHTSWDRQREYLKQPGEYVWYIDEVHVEGEGPFRLEQPMESIPDLGLEMSWSVRGNCTIEPETEVVDIGDGSACLTVELGEAEGSGGDAIARPPDGRPWPATEITFSCLAATAPFLTVFAQDSDGTSVSWVLSEELQMGEWSLVTLSPGQCVNVGAGDDVMNDIALLAFSCHRGKLPVHSVLPPLGPVTWYLDNFEITGDQPVPVKPHPARARDRQALRDDTGDPAEWFGTGRAQVEKELVVVREGASSVQLTMLPQAEGAPGYAVAEARPKEPRRIKALSFWLWPHEAGSFYVVALDAKQRMAQWTVPQHALQAQAWNQSRLALEDASLIQGGEGGGARIAPEQLGPITSVKFVLTQSAGNAASRRTWYIDSVRLLEGEEGS